MYNIFEMFKNLGKLKQLSETLSSEKVVVEKEGIKVVMNGKMEVEELTLNSQLPLNKQQQLLKECFNEAVRKLQLSLMSKFGKI